MSSNPQANTSSANNPQVFAYGPKEGAERFSKHQPLDIKPQFGYQNTWFCNGTNNGLYQRYKDAYDDSPTNQSIINGVVSYLFGDGLVNLKDFADAKNPTIEEIEKSQGKLSQWISQEDAQLIMHDYKLYGGYAVQIIYSYAKVPLRIEYVPIYKLAIGFEENTNTIKGYWFCWDWKNTMRYRPVFYPKFTGEFKENYLEIQVVRRPTAEPFFPVPDYFPGIPWAEVEGEIGNAANKHFKNAIGDITVINYNSGKMSSKELAKTEADAVRKKYCGTDNESAVIVSFNDGPEEAVIVDRVSPPEINQQNVFYAEEAERKLIVAHSVPSILFAGTNAGSGFSSNADEMEVATKVLYRRHINPGRKRVVMGLQPIFNLIPDLTCQLDYIDFKEENNLDNNNGNGGQETVA